MRNIPLQNGEYTDENQGKCQKKSSLMCHFEKHFKEHEDFLIWKALKKLYFPINNLMD